MRIPATALYASAIALLGFGRFLAPAQRPAPAHPRVYAGFDANNYPGDSLLPALRKQFSFTGYWLNDPPNTNANPWAGKRDILLRSGFGFLVLFNGRLDQDILKSQKAGESPAALGAEDAAAAVAAARREGFPPRTILFLDQEQGGRMLPEQAAYLLSWTESVAHAGYLPGLYASGQPVPDGTGPNGKPATITTLEDIRQRVAAQHLNPIAFWAIQDNCPPAPGCLVPNPPAPGRSGTPDAIVWQYAQSPRRPDRTRACKATYARNGDAGNCFPPGISGFFVDLDSATTPDPSHGR